MDGQDRKQYLYSTCLIDVFGGVSSVPKPFMGLFFAAGNGSACVCVSAAFFDDDDNYDGNDDNKETTRPL